jgi:hypothetical protein
MTTKRIKSISLLSNKDADLVKALPGAECDSDHKLLVADFKK